MPPPQVIPDEWAVPAAQLTGITKRGGLLKKAGNMFGFWHHRHVVLSKATLAIYAEESELRPNRVVLVDTVEAVGGPASASNSAQFKVLGVDGFKYNFGCRTEAEKVQWVDSVRAEIESLRMQLDTSVPSICVYVNSAPQTERFFRAYVFLLSGRLALTPVPAYGPKVFDDKNREHRKYLPSALGAAQLPDASHIVFLPPQVTIMDAGQPSLLLDVNWPPPSLPSPQPVGSGVRLNFAGGGDRAKLIEWRDKIKEARETNLTSTFLKDPDFAAAVHEAVWSQHFLPQATAWSSDKRLACPMLTPLWALFYDEGAEDKSRRELLNHVVSVFNAAVGIAPRMTPGSSEPPMQSRAIAFVALLEAFIMAPSVRALFLAFPITERATASTLVADFVAHGRTLELRTDSAVPKEPVHVVDDVYAAFRDLITILRQKMAPSSDWDVIVKKIFLDLVSHPGAGGAVVSAVTESRWFFDKAQDRRKNMPALTYDCLTTFIEPGGGFCVRLFVKIAVIEVDVTVRTMLDSISRSVVITSLREDRRSVTASPNPLIAGLLHPDWEPSANYAILIGIVHDFDLLNDAFWQAFVRAAFKASAPRRVVQFLNSELFAKQGYYYNVATVGHFNNCASTLVEELDSALKGKLVEAGDSSIAMLIEMALRFEHLALETPPELRLFVTLGRWKADVPETRTEMLSRLLSYPGFLVAFASICGANAELMDVATDALTVSTGAAALPSRSATVMGPLVGSARERRRQHLLDSLYGYMATAAVVDKACKSLLLANFLGREEMSTFFASYFSAKKPGAKPGSPPSPSPGVRGQLRDRFVQMLLHEQMLKPAFKLATLSGDIFLSQASHFRPDAIALLGLAPQYMSSASFTSLIEVAMKLGQYSQNAVMSLEHASMNSEVGEQLEVLFNAVKTRKREDFFPGGIAASSISLNDIGECATFMVASKSLLIVSPTAGARLQRMFAHILATSAPATWREQMRGSTTIAFFIKYLDREDLAKAYAAFASMERNKAQPDLLAILEEVRAAYPTPVVATKDLALDGGSQALDKLMADIAKTGAAKPNTPLPLGLLWRITAKWMQMNVVKVTVPMAPRNVQSIAFLLCAAWARRREKGLDPANRTLIAQVGTGEGKSLLIAMLALFSVVELKKRVIILENNKQLLSRDREDFVGFFKNFDIETTEQYFDPAAKITYCLRDNIESEYRKRMFSKDGSSDEPFADTVLIVDEVDALIIDAKPASYYIATDSEKTPALVRAYEALRNDKLQPADVPDEVWTDAKATKASAAELFAKLNKANGVRLVGSQYKILDERCDDTNLLPKALTYLNFDKCGVAPEANSFYYIQSLSRIMASFPTTFGVSGSLGGESERNFMTEMYGARFVQVPGFLDTCTGPPHAPPAMLKDTVYVHDSREQQLEAIVALAVEKRQSVPVLIIMHNPELARHVQKLVSNRLPNGNGRLLDKSGAPEVQLYISEIEKSKLTGIVMKATEPIDENSKEKRFRVTVTDYSGGRGIDYNMPPDSDTDSAGGLLVILSCIPKEGEREWIQWRGRTARKDRRGQYSVILSRADEPVSTQHDLVEKHALPSQPTCYNAAVITDLLSFYDEQNRNTLKSGAASRLTAMRVSEFCDKFWAKFGSAHGDPSGRKWPFDATETDFRDFLTSHLFESNPTVLVDYAVKRGIIADASQYRSKY